MTTNIFIQARMSSERFPGKILAPFKGKPIIQHLIEACHRDPLAQKVVVLTSDHLSDDPLVSYLNYLKVNVFRGDLENVFFRFKQALDQYPCRKFVRLSADSPLMEPRLIQKLIGLSDETADLTTNVHKRTFPKGLSVEVITSETFLGIDTREIDAFDREHVTTHFYRYPKKYRIQSVEASVDQHHESLCIDTLDDLKRLTFQSDPYNFNPEALSVRIV